MMYELSNKYMIDVKRCIKVYRACLILHVILAILQLLTPRPFLFLSHLVVVFIGIDCFCSYLTFKYFCFTVVNMICGISDFIWLLFKCIGKNKFQWLDPQHYWKIINMDNIFLEFLSTSLHYMIEDKESDEESPQNLQKKYEYIKNFFKLLPIQKKTFAWKIYIELFIIVIGIFLYFIGSYISWQLYKYSLNYNHNDLIFPNYHYGTFNDENNKNNPSPQSDFIPFIGQPYRISDFLEKN
ncbi:conserved Plasmodium protein, unknown function [Plasmodium reichenowi]|uniref:Uncharacterized protein n=13 Tax=Plasmodium (Laverania) TaxID=418107 RepID=Q8I394_PLAF7|nr:conserved protein, unknown function [Plasmodium falciparum 3D7]ETW18441.1 hypothetical protein PFFVO_02341 [Plasmodium falciparum Vietnam Oak-Knoll (FVO)]ETW30948.1 hypothetical protein PFFCH_01615 [Plasmodium falciparum FCH/4]ETW36826.1 hypothetical protein PFTANZ_02409 [Plasmodium falciparum Tanzania (2000708)]ETW49630.1 hypothetical protein PFMALIP_02338 [Plasmodium falciparum MaliPS096_E11]ETW56926.1 hypothetical protein PFUGPA_01127 [Plasmodium falciparum Palo Alto/Uganda]ETW61832.1 h|eukprot:XP_001351929.1 conserved Plasmodium protein, unknown function [Plasmodium falciparum 3D7]